METLHPLGSLDKQIKNQLDRINRHEWQKISPDGYRMFWITEHDPDLLMAGLYTRFQGEKGPAIFVIEHYRECFVLDKDNRVVSFWGIPIVAHTPNIRLEALPRRSIPAVPGDLRYQLCERIEYDAQGQRGITGWDGVPFDFTIDPARPDNETFLYTEQDLRETGLTSVDVLPQQIDFIRTVTAFQEQILRKDFRNPTFY